MTNFIPIFPLGIVVYPGEPLNLHIFEPRYKELINECVENNKMFGIPPVMENKVQEFGTLVKIVEVTKRYENGEMDIKTEGVCIFRILELMKVLPEKSYSGAIVNYVDADTDGFAIVMQQLLKQVKELHKLLKVEKTFKKAEADLLSYDIAHHMGLTLQEEYELLQLPQEKQRQEYLKRHLAKVLPMLSEMETLKTKIKLNGHFKNLSGFEL